MDNWIIQLIAPVVISTIVGALGFFIKNSLTKVESGIKENNTKIDELEKKYEKKLSAVQDKFDEEIKGVQKDISDLKADLPLIYVAKEDFIRTLNGIESKMTNIDSKLDRLILK